MEQQPHSFENDEPVAGQMEGDGVLPRGAEAASTATAPEQAAGDAMSTTSEADVPTDVRDETDRPPREVPSIYVASLADYNVGKLHGTWVDMTMPTEDIELAIRQMLERSPVLQADGEDYGDWAIQDSENFGVVTVHEHDDLDTLHELAEGIAEHGEAFSAWAEANEDDAERWPLFTEAYLGEFDSLTAYGEYMVQETGWQQMVDEVMPLEISQYIRVDAEQWAQDLWLSGDIQVMHKPGGGCWIFRGEV